MKKRKFKKNVNDVSVQIVKTSSDSWKHILKRGFYFTHNEIFIYLNTNEVDASVGSERACVQYGFGSISICESSVQ